MLSYSNVRFLGKTLIMGGICTLTKSINKFFDRLTIVSVFIPKLNCALKFGDIPKSFNIET